MTEETKIAIHWAISKLVIIAVPLLNQLLFAIGITVTTSPSTTDNIANFLCIGLGLGYSYWVKSYSKDVHTTKGFSEGVLAATGSLPTASPPVRPVDLSQK